MTMPPFFCNMCKRIVQDGDRHSCFFYKNDEIVFNLQQPDKTEKVFVNRDEATRQHAANLEDNNKNVCKSDQLIGNPSQASTSRALSDSSIESKELDGGSFEEPVDSVHTPEVAQDASFHPPERKLDAGADQPIDLRKVADAVPGPSTIRHRTIGPDGKRLYACDKCNYRSKYKSHFDSHYKTHTLEKPHVCETCNECFSHKGNLKRHERTHTGEKPHVCEKCGKGFAQKENLAAHLRMHTGEKPYKCDTCGKTFSQGSNRNRHLANHKKVKPYEGDFCDKRFSRIRRRSSHNRTHEEGKGRYTCGTCGETFSSNEDRNRHYREKHR